MSLQDRPAAVLSTIVVAGLAVGLGFGAHAIIGETDVAASPSANPSSSNAALGDDFCTLMEDLVVYEDQMSEEMMGSIFLLGEGGSSDAEMLDAVHGFGQVFIDTTGTLSDYLVQAAELVTDPDVAEAFVQLAHATEELGQTWGTAALEAESVEDYGLTMNTLYGDPEFLATMDEGETAEPIVTQFVLDTCGIDLSGDSGTTVESAAQTDVSTLGMQIEMYYFGWQEGDPQPEVTVTDGEYYLNGIYIGEQTPGVTLTDQYARGPEDWCIEVSSDDDPYDVAIYSWSGSGLGRCTVVDVEVTI